MCLIAGVFIDIDHVLDYYIEQPLTLKIKRIHLWYVENRFKRLFIFLHSLELLFALWIIISVFKLGVFWIAFAIGLTQHMILDIIFNKKIIYPYGYFLSYRFIKKFKSEHVCRKFRAAP